MRKIKLSNGQWTKVSDEDYEYISKFRCWTACGGYVRLFLNGERVLLHRLIAERAGIDCSDQIDHINGEKFDNQRENLRAATKSQNLRNQGKRRNNTSGYQGVNWREQTQKWVARIQVNKVRRHLGSFEKFDQAVNAYKMAAKKYHGEFAHASTKIS